MWDTLIKVFEDNTVMSVAFLAWALVVWHFGRKISLEIEELSSHTRKMNYILSNRLTKVEAHLEHDGNNFVPFRNGTS